MKWVTREKARVDRIACPWLISRFIDKEPTFRRQCVPRPTRGSRGSARVELFVSEDVEKPNVSPTVNCQSGTPLVKPRRTPASNHTFFEDQGCQMTPRSAESRWSSRRGL